MTIDRTSLILLAALGWALAGLQVVSNGVGHHERSRVQETTWQRPAGDKDRVSQRKLDVRSSSQQDVGSSCQQGVGSSWHAVGSQRKAVSTKRPHRSVVSHRGKKGSTHATASKRSHGVGLHGHKTVKGKHHGHRTHVSHHGHGSHSHYSHGHYHSHPGGSHHQGSPERALK